MGSRPDAVEVTPGLLIGSAPGKRQRKSLIKAGVDVVVDLRAESDERSDDWPEDVEVRRVPIVDREAPDLDSLTSLASMIATRISNGHHVLVHCHAGIGRSATVVCAVLVNMRWSLADAHRRLRECRPAIAPTDVQLTLLMDYERAMAPPPVEGTAHGRSFQL